MLTTVPSGHSVRRIEAKPADNISAGNRAQNESTFLRLPIYSNPFIFPQYCLMSSKPMQTDIILWRDKPHTEAFPKKPAIHAAHLIPLILLTLACSSSAKIIHVKRNATGANNGTSWSNAYTAIQPAINAAVSGDQVWIAIGIYKPNDSDPTNLSRSLFFSLKNGVAVYGGFAGTETTLAERNPGLYPVTLSGDLLGNDSAAGTLAVSALATMGDNSLQVIRNSSLSSTAVLDSVIVRGGNADGTNSTSSGGGMINSSSASPTIVNCVFVDNRASLGGAVYGSFSSAVFTGCTFCFNTATQGGAIYNQRCPAIKLTNCTLAHNSASVGGAITNSMSNLIATNTTVAYNSSVVVTTGNPSGSGIRSVLSTITSQQSNVYLHNCILWGNLNSLQLFGGNTTASHCIIQGGFTGPAPTIETYNLANILSSDPLISSLGNHGGPTPVIKLPADSPAINAGIPTAPAPASIPTTDQLGILRDPQPDIGAFEYPIHVPTGLNTPLTGIGGTVLLPVSTGLSSSTYQWYQGRTGDTSSPITGATSAGYTTPQLGIGTDFWVAVTSGGQTLASPTLAVLVRGTYPQWVAFHGLEGDDAAADASPALDGLTNLVKFATGLDPFLPVSQSTFLQTSVSNGQFHLDLNLSRTPTDLSWDILELDGASQWAPTPTAAQPGTSTTALQTYRLTLPTTQTSRIFKARITR
jgi:hypothetical protein